MVDGEDGMEGPVAEAGSAVGDAGSRLFTVHRPPSTVHCWVAMVALAAALGWSYAASFAELQRRWASDPNYSHGYLVGPIALAILARRRAQLVPARLAPSAWGWAALLGVL